MLYPPCVEYNVHTTFYTVSVVYLDSLSVLGKLGLLGLDSSGDLGPALHLQKKTRNVLGIDS